MMNISKKYIIALAILGAVGALAGCQDKYDIVGSGCKIANDAGELVDSSSGAICVEIENKWYSYSCETGNTRLCDNDDYKWGCFDKNENNNIGKCKNVCSEEGAKLCHENKLFECKLSGVTQTSEIQKKEYYYEYIRDCICKNETECADCVNRCENGKLSVCKEDGSGYKEVTEDCPLGCNEDGTACASCVSKCENGRLSICKDDGSGYAEAVECPLGCNEEGTACATCANKCENGILKLCKDDKTDYDEAKTTKCPLGCAEDGTKCATCDKNKCENSVLQICNKEGTDYDETNVINCPLGCNEDNTECATCEGNKCEVDELKICKFDNSSYEKTIDCPLECNEDGTDCVRSCTEDVCKKGVIYRCKNGILERNGENCPQLIGESGKINGECANATMCKRCNDNLQLNHRCISATEYIICKQGLWTEEGTKCSTNGQFCSNTAVDKCKNVFIPACYNDRNEIGYLYSDEDNPDNSTVCNIDNKDVSCAEDGKKCGECLNGQTKCENNEYFECISGQYQKKECPNDFGCHEDVNGSGVCNECDNNYCDSKGWLKTCSNGVYDEGDYCKVGDELVSCKSNVECGECKNDEKKCNGLGKDIEICKAGKWTKCSSLICKLGCVPKDQCEDEDNENGKCVTPVTPVQLCTTERCENDILYRCENGSEQKVSCKFGCDKSIKTTEVKCKCDANCPKSCNNDGSCGEKKCIPGDLRCNKNLSEVCSDEGEWKQLMDCGGKLCNENTGMCKDCERGVAYCDSSNSSPSVAYLCNEGETPTKIWCTSGCNNEGLCDLSGCSNKEQMCANDSLYICIDGKYWGDEKKCEFGCVMSDKNVAMCQEEEQCKLSTRKCEGGTFSLCNKVWKEIGNIYCDNKFIYVCNDSSVLKLHNSDGCVNGQLTCKSHANKCIDNYLFACDGSKFIFNKECEFGCDEEIGCYPECTPNEKKCEENAAYLCTKNGKWEKYESCDLGCNIASGQCNNCASGTKICEDNILKSCEDGYWVSKNCPWGCYDSTQCKDCYPGIKECEDSNLKTCKDNSWEVTQCKFGCYTNQSGDVKCGECVPGSVECTYTNNAKICTQNGEWGESISCPGGCQNNVCYECQDNVKECVNTKLAKRCENGTWVEHSCSENEVCDSDSGECVGSSNECVNGQINCLLNGTAQICMGGESKTFQCDNCEEHTCVMKCSNDVCIPFSNKDYKFACKNGNVNWNQSTLCSNNSCQSCSYLE